MDDESNEFTEAKPTRDIDENESGENVKEQYEAQAVPEDGGACRGDRELNEVAHHMIQTGDPQLK